MDQGDAFIASPEHRMAYLTARMPATYAALWKVMQEVTRRLPNASIESLLDLGSGPGTALWAAADVFSELKSATLIEQDREFIEISRRLAAQGSEKVFLDVDWQSSDLSKLAALEKQDAVVLSYVLGEFSKEEQQKILELSWQAAGKIMIVIEPGTPLWISKYFSCTPVFH